MLRSPPQPRNLSRLPPLAWQRASSSAQASGLWKWCWFSWGWYSMVLMISYDYLAINSGQPFSDHSSSIAPSPPFGARLGAASFVWLVSMPDTGWGSALVWFKSRLWEMWGGNLSLYDGGLSRDQSAEANSVWKGNWKCKYSKHFYFSSTVFAFGRLKFTHRQNTYKCLEICYSQTQTHWKNPWISGDGKLWDLFSRMKLNHWPL